VTLHALRRPLVALVDLVGDIHPDEPAAAAEDLITICTLPAFEMT
jgi:predicted deacylase